MRIIDLVLMGLRNLRRRKARTALTIVGVVIGTISIIVMISLGIGLDVSYEKQLMEVGNLKSLTIYNWVDHEDADGNYTSEDVTNLMGDDMVAQLKEIDHVCAVTGKLDTNITFTGSNWFCNAYGYAIDFSCLKDLGFPELEEGEYDTTSGTDQMIFGHDCFPWRQNKRTMKEIEGEFDWDKEKLFYQIGSDFGEEPSYEEPVVDVTTGEGDSAEVDPVQPTPKKKKIRKLPVNNKIVLPQTDDYEFASCFFVDITFYKKAYNEYIKNLPSTERKQQAKALEKYTQIQVIVDNVKNIESVQKNIKDLGLQAYGPGDYAAQVKKQAKTIELILGGIGAIAMIVSAISIANTMVMSIYERTKEIGVMKVLGCVVTDIKKLFLLEAGIIGLLGGIVGVIFSYILSYVMNHYGGSVFGMAFGIESMPGQDIQLSIIPIWLALAALAFAFLVGVLSGYFPAKRATKISAIEAMKTEG